MQHLITARASDWKPCIVYFALSDPNSQRMGCSRIESLTQKEGRLVLHRKQLVSAVTKSSVQRGLYAKPLFSRPLREEGTVTYDLKGYVTQGPGQLNMPSVTTFPTNATLEGAFAVSGCSPFHITDALYYHMRLWPVLEGDVARELVVPACLYPLDSFAANKVTKLVLEESYAKPKAQELRVAPGRVLDAVGGEPICWLYGEDGERAREPVLGIHADDPDISDDEYLSRAMQQLTSVTRSANDPYTPIRSYKMHRLGFFRLSRMLKEDAMLNAIRLHMDYTFDDLERDHKEILGVLDNCGACFMDMTGDAVLYPVLEIPRLSTTAKQVAMLQNVFGDLLPTSKITDPDAQKLKHAIAINDKTLMEVSCESQT